MAITNRVKTTQYGNKKNILLNPDQAVVIPVQVTNTGTLPAGTVLGGATSVLDSPNTVLAEVNGATAQGILLNDLYNGETNGVMVVAGVIDSSKIASFSTKVPSAAREVMPNIIFRNGEYD